MDLINRLISHVLEHGPESTVEEKNQVAKARNEGKHITPSPRLKSLLDLSEEGYLEHY